MKTPRLTIDKVVSDQTVSDFIDDRGKRFVNQRIGQRPVKAVIAGALDVSIPKLLTEKGIENDKEK